MSGRSSRAEHKSRDHEISVQNIFSFNFKPTPPPSLSMLSIEDNKGLSFDRINLKPLSENVDPNRRTDKPFIIKKLFARLPEPEIFDFSSDELRPRPLRKRSVSATSTPPNLNELITLKKIKATPNNGVFKRVLHVPTFRIFDVQVIFLMCLCLDCFRKSLFLLLEVQKL